MKNIQKELDNNLPFLSYVIKPNETVKGGSDGDWIYWHNWLLGDYVSQEIQSEILFLAGNMNYGYTEGESQGQGQKRTKKERPTRDWGIRD